MNDDLVKRWDEYVESMGCVMGEVEHMAQQMRDRIEELETKLAKALTALGDVQWFVKDLEPYADQGHTLVPALQKACAVYVELTGGKDG